jgi:hydroxymethylpyrimidine pyrophosphatase-like HAD family hydrolase
MDNASDFVKSHADVVTASNENDGIWKYLKAENLIR